ncbi:hypothetical protein LSH36_16g14031 [Paralvinella palmiformis]|uniref:Peptidase metallopeptidase domain-containing protein n=1 Tax=Paralvinella palmiformis TaxID=53620 RepID=A0AAD9KC25_9ANNE|nr:hypothetical protein LSH36_16g14031 [Paralvinella palmiformis]
MWRLKRIVLYLTTISLLGLVTSQDIPKMTEAERRKFALDMLSQVFVLSKSESGQLRSVIGDLREDDLSENLKAYQMLHSLPVTAYMWNNKMPLTYWFKTYSAKLPRETQRRILAEAFKMWSDNAGINFREGSGSDVDIELVFSRDHINDGPGKVLAHAYYPSNLKLAGDVHFDEDEDWTEGSLSGTNLFQIAVHELGHSLGIGHSNSPSSVMFHTYRGYKPNLQLDDDDISAIQSLYGPAANTSQSTTMTQWSNTITQSSGEQSSNMTSSVERKKFCADGRFDAITSFQGITYAFKGNAYAVLLDNGMVPGYPRHISEKFDGLEGVSKIDAALSWERHNTPRLYLFSGDKFWRYDNKGLRSGYPKLIKAGFPGLPSDIDAAFVWKRTGFTYVFKGEKYYRLTGKDGNTAGRVYDGYPRDIKFWKISSVFRKIDAIFAWQDNDRTYMFSGDQYIRFDDKNSAGVSQAIPPYPRKTNDWWLMCDPKWDQSKFNETGEDGDDLIVVIHQQYLFSSSLMITQNVLFTTVIYVLLYLLVS